jgi:hypothetical protein
MQDINSQAIIGLTNRKYNTNPNFYAYDKIAMNTKKTGRCFLPSSGSKSSELSVTNTTKK